MVCNQMFFDIELKLPLKSDVTQKMYQTIEVRKHNIQDTHA